MVDVKDIAMFFLSKDTENKLFNKTLVEKNGRTFYEGNARLNKLLHLSQNLYIALKGEKLFDADLYAYDNGAVVTDIQENYALLLNKKYDPVLADDITAFLDKVNFIFRNATLDELIELSHEDDEWISKHNNYKKSDQKMNSLANIATYKEQYNDVLMVMGYM